MQTKTFKTVRAAPGSRQTVSNTVMTGAILCAAASALVMTTLAEIPEAVQRSGLNAPRSVKDAKPVYPPASLVAGDEGAVLLELQITTSGSVSQARVLWSSCPVLNDAALTAARAWEYEVRKVNGTPTAYVLSAAQVTFRLPADKKARAGSPGSCVWKDPPKPTT